MANSIFHLMTKYIVLCYHFIKSLLEDEVSIFVKIQGGKNPTNMLTKIVIIEKLELCIALMGHG